MISTIIQQWQEIVVLATLSATLSLFLDFCFRDGNIFGGWLEFLARWWLGKNGIKSKKDREDMFQQVKWWAFKPLGYCIVCSNVWLTAFICVLFSPMLVIPVVLLSNFIVRYFYDRLL